MPALSPTMTEGNIATWKVKEGDSFVAGDVLLEIETDKAQMDVEAQDDGILAKIIVWDGSKAVQVGSRIGVTAEPGDDLSSLDIPPEESPAPKKADTTKEQPKQESASVPKEERTSSPPPAPESISTDAPNKATGGKAQKQTYPLSPSILHLLSQNGLPKEEADKIPATGPKGRLLKGDVLAYLGLVEGSYPAELSARIAKLTHLDLSDVNMSAPKEPPAKKSAPVPEAPAVAEEIDVEVALPVSLKAVVECQKRVQESIGVFLPLSTYIARATELANDDLPRPKTHKPSADELFNAVLGLDMVAGKKYARGQFIPQVSALPTTTLGVTRSTLNKKPDVLDILAGKKAVRPSKAFQAGVPHRGIASSNLFSVQVPKGDQKRGQIFLQRIKSILEAEPGRLVV
ncbi:pyruvate dehydrogenase protein x component [Massariosphaeria phaeospora]|uniref:Pyruvate dehydrogenase protein x component n=1 Tax=Massariosphaeria phaeospora TaxID=100035 RepID=A0A7C8I9P2_9PLEO|nr:pyruvate dehydrogenase protein x component [Massariosphaeria phaeospora]